tara:strand:+ start:1207 stop:1473 length:267 start_codon:yes stop_codon:yes gene_type:complete
MGWLPNYNMSEDDNKKEETATIIDFTVVKLQRLIDSYEDAGLYEQADEVYTALSKYQAGDLQIKWQKGMPFVVVDAEGRAKKPTDEDV